MSNQAPLDAHELTPPLINISLWMFIEKYCVGMEQRACITKPFASYLRDQFDPGEIYLHIEPTETKPETLFYVYPIQVWRESLERRKRQQAISESSRQIRFALAEEEKQFINKIQRRRDILSEAVADALKGPAGGKLSKYAKEFTEYLCFKCLIGESPASMAALNISLELINEFKGLPVDPEWKNKYWNA